MSEALSDEREVGGPGAPDPGIARDLDILRVVERPLGSRLVEAYAG